MLVHWIWYATLPGISLRQKLAILEHFSDPEDIYNAESFSHIPELTPQMQQALGEKDLTKAKTVIKECAAAKISILTFHDAAYPSRLRNIPDAPLVLYYKGVLPDFEGQPVIGVVGTRKSSPYGMRHAKTFSRQIAACGGLVVSGGATGIDTAALEGAMETGAQTVAVLGFGADVIYPRTNRNLFARIEKNGCLITEYVPGTKPKPWQFPERNRIISGLSNGVLVVEAPERSGALITARDAFDQGRDVYAVPGNIDVATCVGSNALLQDYGHAVVTGWDVLKAYADRYPGVEKREAMVQPDMAAQAVAQVPQYPGVEPISDKKDIDNPENNAYSVLDKLIPDLSGEEKEILRCLGPEPKSVDDVIAQLEIPAGRVLSVLTRLSIKGLVINHPGRLVSAAVQIQ